MARISSLKTFTASFRALNIFPIRVCNAATTASITVKIPKTMANRFDVSMKKSYTRFNTGVNSFIACMLQGQARLRRTTGIPRRRAFGGQSPTVFPAVNFS